MCEFWNTTIERRFCEHIPVAMGQHMILSNVLGRHGLVLSHRYAGSKADRGSFNQIDLALLLEEQLERPPVARQNPQCRC